MQAILRLPAVKSRTGLSRTTIYERVKAGAFPRPVNLGARAVGWLDSDIDEWLAKRIQESREEAQVDHCPSGQRAGNQADAI